PTVIASITVVFSLYFCEALHLPKTAQLPVGVVAILVLTLVNWIGVHAGAGTQSLFTTLKVVGILGLVVCAFTLHSSGAPAGQAVAPALANHPLLLAMVLAMIPILFAYDGWTDSTYVAGEVVNPRRTLPIAIVWGTVLVIAVYVLTNLAYFRVLTP